jgi:SAM-dependent methyltransferase
MTADQSMIACAECGQTFRCENGIPLLFWPTEWQDSKKDVTDVIKSFYEQNPFPNYEDMDSNWSLREKAERAVFPRLLDEQVPHGSKILEVGCGTGQLSNFLGMAWGRTVFGADLCLNSLKLGQNFKLEKQIENVAFLQMNLFRPVFRPETFDLVICNGVLHHTSDPYLGFQSILKLVKPGGHILVGLYSAYGRIITDIRRLAFKFSANRFAFGDSRLKDKRVSATRRRTWFMDQYMNPHESKHTMGEVLKWFDRSGVEFISGIPKLTAFDQFSPEEKLFVPSPRGTRLGRFFVQMHLLLRGGKEGGFFIMIGRRK